MCHLLGDFNLLLRQPGAEDLATARSQRLGYRGVIITHSSGGTASRIQVLNGKIKVCGATASETLLEDSARLESHFLGLMKGNATVARLIKDGIVPNPESL